MSNKATQDVVLNIRAKVDQLQGDLQKAQSALNGLNLNNQLGKEINDLTKKFEIIQRDSEKGFEVKGDFTKIINDINSFNVKLEKIQEKITNIISDPKALSKFAGPEDQKQVEAYKKAIDSLKESTKDLISKQKSLETELKKKTEYEEKAPELKAQNEQLKEKYEQYNKQVAALKQLGKSAKIAADYQKQLALSNDTSKDQEVTKKAYEEAVRKSEILNSVANAYTKNGGTGDASQIRNGNVEQIIQITKEAKAALKEYSKELTKNNNELKQNQENINESISTIEQLKTEISSIDANQLKEAQQILASYNIDPNSLKSTEDLKNLLEDLTNVISNKTGENLGNFKKELASTGEKIEEVSLEAETGKEQLINYDLQISDVTAFTNRLKSIVGLAGGYRILRTAVQEAISTIQELDATMTETAVVTDYSVSDMWSQLPEYTARANELGVAINDVYEASTLYYQQGLKTNEVTQVTTATMKMARIAGLDAEEATSRMTNALRGFNMAINETNADNVADVYSKLASISASNVDEISTAMTKVASLANSAGMSFENTAAFLSQIIETTRESAETAGTALKTVIARFSEIKEDPTILNDSEGEEVSYNKIDTALKSIGISMDAFMKGEEGLDQVFLRLAEKWDSLDTVTQRYIATQAAGSRQQSRFIALMSDYQRTMELTTAATSASGAADEQYAKTLESLQTKLQKLKNAWDEFTMGIVNNSLLKGAVDILTWLLEKVNEFTSALGGSAAKITLVASVLGLANLGVNKGTKALIAYLTQMGLIKEETSKISTLIKIHTDVQGKLTKALTGILSPLLSYKKSIIELNPLLSQEQKLQALANLEFKTGEKTVMSFGETLVTVLPELLAIAAAIAAIVVIAKELYNRSIPGLISKQEDALDKLEETQSDLDDVNSELEEIQEKIEDINNSNTISFTSQSELKNLQRQVELLKIRKDLVQDTVDKQKQAVNTAAKAVQTGYSNAIDNTYSSLTSQIDEVNNQGDLADSSKQAAIDSLINSANMKALEKLESMLTDVDTSNFSEQDWDEYWTKVKESAQVIFKNGGMDLGQYFEYSQDPETTQQWKENIAKITGDITEADLNDIFGENNVSEFIALLQEAGSENPMADLVQSIKEMKPACEQAVKEAENLNAAFSYKGVVSDLDTIQEKISSLQSALSDMNDDGKVSVDTIASISDAFSDLGIDDELEQSLSDLTEADSYEEVQKAVNNLATAYLNSDNVLNNLNKDTVDNYAQKLKDIGITNAEKLAYYKLYQQQIKNGEITLDEINKLEDCTEEQKDVLTILLQTNELKENEIALNSANIQSLSNLANKYKGTCEQAARYASALVLLSEAEDAYNKARLGGYYEDDGEGNQVFVGVEQAKYRYDQALKTVQNDLKAWQEVGITVGNEVTVGKGDTSSSSSESYWENPLERHFNLLQEINKEQNKLNKLANQYAIQIARVYTDGANDMQKILDIQQQQEQSYASQLGYQTRLAEGYKKDLEALNTEYEKYNDYLKFEDGKLVVGNEQTWQDLEDGKLKSDDETAIALTAMYDKFTEYYNDWVEATEEESQLREEYESRRSDAEDTKIDLINDIADNLEEKEQRKIDLMQDQLDATEEANSSLLSSIRSNFDKLRQENENAKTEDEIADLTKKIAYLKQDTTGGNALTIKQLEKELKEKQDDYTNDLIDQAIDDQESQYEDEVSQRQREIDILQGEVDYNREHGIYKEQAEEMLTRVQKALEDGTATILSNEITNLNSEINTDLTEMEINKEASEIADSLSEIYTYLTKDYSSAASKALEGKDYDALLTYAENYLADAVNSGTSASDAKAGLISLLGIEGSDMGIAANAAYGNGNSAYAEVINKMRDELITSYGLSAQTGYNYKTGQFETSIGDGATSETTTPASSLKENSELTSAQKDAIQDVIDNANYGMDKSSKNEKNIRKVQTLLKEMGIDIGGIDGKYGDKTIAGVKELQERINSSGQLSNAIAVDGLWGKETVAALKVLLEKNVAFKSGGIANFTGPAWLDGTSAHPELVLNAQDTENFIQLKDILRGLMGGTTNNSSIGDSYVNVDVNVDSVADGYDIEQIVQDIKRSIYKDSMYRNVNFVSTLK